MRVNIMYKQALSLFSHSSAERGKFVHAHLNSETIMQETYCVRYLNRCRYQRQLNLLWRNYMPHINYYSVQSVCVQSGSDQARSGRSVNLGSLISNTPYWLLLKSLSPCALPLPPPLHLVNSEQLIGHDRIYVPAS